MKPDDAPKRPVDEYARGSFTWRRMTPGQITGLIIALLLMLIALIWWS